jgi:hypothetical protein
VVLGKCFVFLFTPHHHVFVGDGNHSPYSSEICMRAAMWLSLDQSAALGCFINELSRDIDLKREVAELLSLCLYHEQGTVSMRNISAYIPRLLVCRYIIFHDSEKQSITFLRIVMNLRLLYATKCTRVLDTLL